MKKPYIITIFLSLIFSIYAVYSSHELYRAQVFHEKVVNSQFAVQKCLDIGGKLSPEIGSIDTIPECMITRENIFGDKETKTYRWSGRAFYLIK